MTDEQTTWAADVDPIAEARRLIAEDEQHRMQACLDEIEQILDKHGMRMTVVPARVTLTPKD